ncbi:MAG: rod shape-determining protein MreD [Pseudomonadota bacterium]
MVDPVTARLWSYRALFVVLVAVIAVGRLMPVDAGSTGLPGPDLLLALTFAWVLRRPAYVPAWLVVALFLPLDLIFHQPPGLGALTVLVATEVLRGRKELSAGLPFPIEWALVAVALVATAGALQILMGLFLVPRPPLGLELLRALLTAAIYPVVVAVSAHGFGVRKATPGEVDALGARL